jgi:hypothetical protein
MATKRCYDKNISITRMRVQTHKQCHETLFAIRVINNSKTVGDLSKIRVLGVISDMRVRVIADGKIISDRSIIIFRVIRIIRVRVIADGKIISDRSIIRIKFKSVISNVKVISIRLFVLSDEDSFG